MKLWIVCNADGTWQTVQADTFADAAKVAVGNTDSPAMAVFVAKSAVYSFGDLDRCKR